MEFAGTLAPGYESSLFPQGEAGMLLECSKLLWTSCAKIPIIRPSSWECNVTTNSPVGGIWDRTDT